MKVLATNTGTNEILFASECGRYEVEIIELNKEAPRYGHESGFLVSIIDYKLDCEDVNWHTDTVIEAISWARTELARKAKAA